MEDAKYKIMNNHWYNEGKEILNQGRTEKQYKSSAIGAFVSGLSLIIIFILIAIFG
tara:strand:- start:2480 stop:2647 length:168 start_codon:yes stop_codon:yes gene_type:complete